MLLLNIRQACARSNPISPNSCQIQAQIHIMKAVNPCRLQDRISIYISDTHQDHQTKINQPPETQKEDKNHNKKIITERTSPSVKNCKKMLIFNEKFKGCFSHLSNKHEVTLRGFHVVAKIIRELKSHMIPYKFKCSHWWKINFKKRFALQSECYDFNQ